MVGRKHLLICALALATSTAPMAGQDPTPAAKHGGKRFGKKADQNSPEFDNVRRAIDALTPEQRRRFQENFVRWSNLSAEDKRALRDQDEVRRKRVRQEVEKAIEEAGLQLDEERHEQFAKRYAEERRKVEEQLRRETQEKRQPRLREIVGKLKEEFSGTAETVTSQNP
jgi:hypothetical protein